jgi:hypothetical protein
MRELSSTGIGVGRRSNVVPVNSHPDERSVTEGKHLTRAAGVFGRTNDTEHTGTLVDDEITDLAVGIHEFRSFWK